VLLGYRPFRMVSAPDSQATAARLRRLRAKARQPA
jgi:hypothetical protein